MVTIEMRSHTFRYATAKSIRTCPSVQSRPHKISSLHFFALQETRRISLIAYGDSKYSAMSRTVGFPTGIGAKLVLDGTFLTWPDFVYMCVYLTPELGCTKYPPNRESVTVAIRVINTST